MGWVSESPTGRRGWGLPVRRGRFQKLGYKWSEAGPGDFSGLFCPYESSNIFLPACCGVTGRTLRDRLLRGKSVQSLPTQSFGSFSNWVHTRRRPGFSGGETERGQGWRLAGAGPRWQSRAWEPSGCTRSLKAGGQGQGGGPQHWGAGWGKVWLSLHLPLICPLSQFLFSQWLKPKVSPPAPSYKSPSSQLTPALPALPPSLSQGSSDTSSLQICTSHQKEHVDL